MLPFALSCAARLIMHCQYQFKGTHFLNSSSLCPIKSHGNKTFVGLADYRKLHTYLFWNGCVHCTKSMEQPIVMRVSNPRVFYPCKLILYMLSMALVNRCCKHLAIATHGFISSVLTLDLEPELEGHVYMLHRS